MKSTIAYLAAIGVTLGLTGCVVTSVYPFYTDKDLVFEPKLIGSWKPAKDGDTKERWTFSRVDGKGYGIVNVDSSGSSTNAYEGHLFKLDGQLLLDVAPTERHDDFIPPHYVMKVLQIEPAFRISLLSQDWLEKQLVTDPQSVRHLKIRGQRPDEDRTVLTDTPPQLQAFLRKHLTNTNAWGDADEFTRQSH